MMTDSLKTQSKVLCTVLRQRWKQLNLNGLVDGIDGCPHTAVNYCNGNAAKGTKCWDIIHQPDGKYLCKVKARGG